jgi:threonylcarbamoyladenosine tRNA methylthiotransferase MtaB
LVLGNDRKADLLSLLGEQTQRPSPEIPLMVSERLVAIPYEERNRDLSNRRTRTFIKAQEGCRNFCAYCVVPLVRSKEQSVPADEVIAQINEVVAGGGKEVVLTGTEIGAYNSEGADLKGLVERILAETDIRRLRLSSLQPHQVTPELVALWKDPRLCPHFHLSLQNGSDTVLKRMRRLYTTADYRKTVALIRKSAPDGAITTDIIVGFPGETEAEFKESHDFCAEMRFARIHVFPFSPRPGTAAATMPNQVKEKVKKERSRLMLALAKESARDFHLRFLGKTMEVLWEQQSGSAWTGLTGNYIKVYVNSSKNLTDEITPVKLVKVYKDGVWGEEEG